MNQNYLTNKQNSLRMIQLSDVGDKLNLKDRGAIKKWLKKEDIYMYKRGKNFYVYEIELDYALLKPYLIALRLKSPNKWKQIYRVVCLDEMLYEYTLLQIDENPIIEQLTKVRPQSKEDNKLLEQLLR